MKKFVSKSVAAIVTAGSVLSPVASQFTTATVARLGTVAAVSSAAMMAPSAAYAQSGKRMCGTVWDNSVRYGSMRGLASIGMEISKYDFVTCPASVITWVTITAFQSRITSFAQGFLNNSASVGTGLIGNIRMNETCEGFSRRVRANTNDVCLKMTDYKLYVFVNVGNSFSMGRV